MRVERVGARYQTRLVKGDPVAGHQPAVDVLFESVAESAGSNALGVILTGMGFDGALGTKALRNSGAATIAQDEATSIVFGMPARAIETGAVKSVLPLRETAGAIANFGNARSPRVAG